MDAKIATAHRREVVSIPAGFAIGAALGGYLGEPAWGMSLGLMLGATASMVAEYKNGDRSIVLPIVGGGASLWTLGLLFIERM
jgi:hypothetical protein